MATMTVRSTYSLDSPTVEAVRELSIAWGTSQAEVIRRSVLAAKKKAASENPRMTPAELVAHYRALTPQMTREDMERQAAVSRQKRHASGEARAARLDVDEKRIRRQLAARKVGTA